jgi:hypothetical protein
MRKVRRFAGTTFNFGIQEFMRKVRRFAGTTFNFGIQEWMNRAAFFTQIRDGNKIS